MFEFKLKWKFSAHEGNWGVWVASPCPIPSSPHIKFTFESFKYFLINFTYFFKWAPTVPNGSSLVTPLAKSMVRAVVGTVFRSWSNCKSKRSCVALFMFCWNQAAANTHRLEWSDRAGVKLGEATGTGAVWMWVSRSSDDILVTFSF